MKIIPYESYVKHSDKSSLEVKNTINDACASVPLNVRVLKFDHESKPLVGNSTENTFLVYRNIGYRNSFLPFAFGNVYTEGTGTLINIKIRMHAVITVFMIFYKTLLLLALASLISTSAPISLILITFFILVISSMLMYFAFWREVAKLNKIIETLL